MRSVTSTAVTTLPSNLVEDVEGEDGEEARAPSIHVVENWYEEFRERE